MFRSKHSLAAVGTQAVPSRTLKTRRQQLYADIALEEKRRDLADRRESHRDHLQGLDQVLDDSCALLSSRDLLGAQDPGLVAVGVLEQSGYPKLEVFGELGSAARVGSARESDHGCGHAPIQDEQSTKLQDKLQAGLWGEVSTGPGRGGNSLHSGPSRTPFSALAADSRPRPGLPEARGTRAAKDSQRGRSPAAGHVCRERGLFTRTTRHNAQLHLWGEPRKFSLEYRKHERRKQRLRRGAHAFAVELESRGLPRRGMTMLTLTVASVDAELGGRIRAFWHTCKQRWPHLVYFSWPELQERGVIHYHAYIADAPGPRQGFTHAWIRDTWALGHVFVHFEKAHRVRGRLVADAVAYVKKMGWKAYQQAYDTFPAGLRAFETSRLTMPYARLVMVAPLIAELVERIGLGMVAAAKKIGGGAYRFLAQSRWGSRAPPSELTVKQLVTVDIPLRQGTFWGFELSKVAA